WHRAAFRPAIAEWSGRRERGAAAVDQNDGVRFDPRRELSYFAPDGRAELLERWTDPVARLRGVGIERRFQRRIFRERRSLRLQVPLAPVLECGNRALALVEVVRDGLSDLLAQAHANEAEHGDQQQRDHRKRADQRSDEKPRPPTVAGHRASPIGSAISSLVV